MIKFSVTIPAFKKRFLAEAIESVLSQTYEHFELIIVDDCSPENLKSVVDQYSDDRIRYYRNNKNCGSVDVVDNWNICLGYCTGDYVICMGDDDRLLPCCLEEYRRLIEKYPGIGLLHGWTELIDEYSSFMDIQAPRPEYETVLSIIWNRWNNRHFQFIGDWCFNIDFLRSDGGFFKLPLAWGSDDISAVKAASYNGVVNTQKLCFQYRQSRYTISLSDNYEIKVHAKQLEKQWYKSFLTNVKVEKLSYEDLKYKQGINSIIDHYYNKEILNLISSDIRKRPTRALHWLKQSKGLNTKHYKIIFLFIKEFLRSFVRK